MWTVTDVIFWGSKITADGDYSHEIKIHLLLGRKVMTNLVSILKSCPSRQSYGFSGSHVWMWKLDYKQSWAPKNWWFWNVVLEKTPLYRRVPYIARRSNQSILKEIIPEYALEGLILKLKLQYFGHLMRRTDSLEKTLMLGKIEGRRRRGWQGVRWLEASLTRWTWVWVSSENWWWTGKPGLLQSMGSQRVRHGWETELNWCSVHNL